MTFPFESSPKTRVKNSKHSYCFWKVGSDSSTADRRPESSHLVDVILLLFKHGDTLIAMVTITHYALHRNRRAVTAQVVTADPSHHILVCHHVDVIRLLFKHGRSTRSVDTLLAMVSIAHYGLHRNRNSHHCFLHAW